jgi:hypothetical protein
MCVGAISVSRGEEREKPDGKTSETEVCFRGGALSAILEKVDAGSSPA